jgi:hypothetical protein
LTPTIVIGVEQRSAERVALAAVPEAEMRRAA